MKTHHFVWLFMVIVDLHAVSAGQYCLGEQKSLLLQLKDSLIWNKTSSKILVKWNQTSDCCTWEGVTSEEGLVTGLNLSNESISGKIDSSTLFNLIYLKSLDLSFNNISSRIPSRIGSLTNLSYLNLSNAGFGGQIPQEISHLTNLVILDLSSFYYLNPTALLKLDQSPNLRMLVQNLTELEELYLDGVVISAPGNEWGQALSSSLPNLRVLSLSQCNLSGPIDQSLSRLQSLSVIQLSGNNLSTTVPGFFANYSNLASLHLGFCGLYGTFPKEIFKVPTLQTLYLSFNELLEGYLPEFPKNSSLQLLQLRHTNFFGRFPSSIGNLRNLSKLDLFHCQFRGAIPDSLVELAQLAYLDLSFNNFSGSILSSRWESLIHLVNFHLDYNFLSGSIPSSLFTLPSLQTIRLSHNRFSGRVLDFPNAAFSVLRTVDLSNNNLQGSIPKSIFKLRKLSTLTLSFNNFNSTIQLDIIQGLNSLHSLELSYSNLSVNASGKDSNFSSPPNLRIIKLASCKLREFPYLKNQAGLLLLDLSYNQISGEVPNWVSEVGNTSLLHLNLSHNHLIGIQEPYYLPNLVVLDLHLNHLQGKFPILPPSASYIDLSSNNFTSSIPSDIGKNLSVSTFFSLSNNGLTGSIPESICNAAYLQVLDISKNNLRGNIPTCVPEMSKTLGVLNLRSNNLSGPLPDVFPLDCSLRTLDLHGNLLTDRIPKSLTNCRELEVLDLGNNKMVDTFPSLLKNISTLRVLVLRSNRFYGQITCHKSIGDWPVIQIFDVASNNFGGEVPGRCLTKWQTMATSKAYAGSQLDLLRFNFFRFEPFLYYRDAVAVTTKGHEMDLTKILTAFTLVDFSSNSFRGQIPEELGQLKSLHALDLSKNALSGQIPSSLGNMQQLESLELSRNHLNGTIPTSLSNLNFLSFMNLSYNHFHGRIPVGNQIQTFAADFFEGNEGLPGLPLTTNCTDNVAGTLPKTSKDSQSKSGIQIEWDLVSAELGFIFGSGIVILPLLFSRRWRTYYFDGLEDIAIQILPKIVVRKLLSLQK